MAAILFFILGFIVLIVGAHALVSGGVGVAKRFHIPPLVIGLTVIAFGTSAPEIGVSSVAAWKGEGGLAIGNIVGSNILNILMVLGLGATIRALVVQRKLIYFDVPLMIVLSGIFWLMALGGALYRWEGILLVLGVIGYLIFTFKKQKKEPPPQAAQPKMLPLWQQIGLLVIGLFLLWLGSDLVVRNGVTLARLLHVNELIIGLTLIAFGTSLPEIATSLTALLKKESDLAVGNVIGSNIFNLLAVTGIAALIAPEPIVIPQNALAFDIPVMTAAAIACLPIFLSGHRISRWEGFLFLFYYFIYIGYLIFETLDYPTPSLFTIAFFFFILPLTMITLGIGVFRHFKR